MLQLNVMFTLILAHLCTGALNPGVPPPPHRVSPPFLTTQQKLAISKLSAAAANASAAATDQLLRHLDSNVSRTALASDCPQLANASAQDILGRLLVHLLEFLASMWSYEARVSGIVWFVNEFMSIDYLIAQAELRVSELVETVGARRYQSVEQLTQTNFLYNLWEASSLHLQIEHPSASHPRAFSSTYTPAYTTTK